MGKKKSGSSGNLAVTIGTAAAVFVARKGLTAAWTRATGKTPPTDPADRSVSIVEALSFAAIAGVTAEVVRLLVVRGTTKPAPAVEATADAN
jgi:hypothetical protein